MKCPSCNYEYEGKYGLNEYETIKGDEKFIDIYTEHSLKIDNPKECTHGDYDYETKIKVSLKACPKCKTVILDTDD